MTVMTVVAALTVIVAIIGTALLIALGIPEMERSRFDVTVGALSDSFDAARREGRIGPGPINLWLHERLQGRARDLQSASRLLWFCRHVSSVAHPAVVIGLTDMANMLADTEGWEPDQQEAFRSFHHDWARAQTRLLRWGHPLGPIAYPFLRRLVARWAAQTVQVDRYDFQIVDFSVPLASPHLTLI